jgi:DNA-binding HxlR family transcriptional regulator
MHLIVISLYTSIVVTVVVKVYSNEKPVRVEYHSTEKGLALQPILDIMAAYSLKYYSKDVFKDGKTWKRN